MSISKSRKLRALQLCFSLALALGMVWLNPGQTSNAQTNQGPAQVYRSVPNGSKLKFQGVVIERNADTMIIRDRSRADYQVAITDRTSIKTHGGFFSSGKKYPVTDILRGLIVEVEGRGDAQGQLVAEKIRFRESDMRAAITSETRVGPVEENQQKIAGQIDELHAIAQEARQEVAKVNDRITSLDEVDQEESVAVTFRVNSAVLSAEAKQQLDAFAVKALAAKGYMIEVAGHTDSTGGEAKNIRLSRARADSVVEYLAIHHKIPARRFITPLGYGKNEAVADNRTVSGRAQNRRVEVKLLVNRGLRTASTTTQP
jgi:outer membrane protein OmpA-like peptidoglycan-associated protein